MLIPEATKFLVQLSGSPVHHAVGLDGPGLYMAFLHALQASVGLYCRGIQENLNFQQVPECTDHFMYLNLSDGML